MQTQAQQNKVTQLEKPLIIPQTPVGEEGRVDVVFSAVKQHMGFIPDGLRLYSLSPALLETFVANISYFNCGERIPATLMTLIRYLVSSESKCNFCIDFNEGLLTSMGLDLASIRAARNSAELAPIAAKEKPLLMIALKSVNNPESVSANDIQTAKAQGWSDRDIFDVVAQAASNRAFSYVLRTFKIESQGAFA